MKYFRSTKTSLIDYVDMNPRLIIRTKNLRFAAYRCLTKVRGSDKSLTEQEKEMLGGSLDSDDETNFIGDYEAIPHKFTIVGKPWVTGNNLTSQENKILSAKINSNITLLKDTYTVEEL